MAVEALAAAPPLLSGAGGAQAWHRQESRRRGPRRGNRMHMEVGQRGSAMTLHGAQRGAQRGTLRGTVERLRADGFGMGELAHDDPLLQMRRLTSAGKAAGQLMYGRCSTFRFCLL